MHVACEAMINPNDKSFRNYTDEAFIYGWCDDCNTGVVLSDVDEVKEHIIKLHEDFYARYGTEPLYAQCDIMWKSDDDSHTCPEPATFKLSTEVDDATDDKISFYCDGIGQLMSLAEFDGEDFVLTDCRYLTNEL